MLPPVAGRFCLIAVLEVHPAVSPRSDPADSAGRAILVLERTERRIEDDDDDEDEDDW